jgi:hypothetical protein
LIVRASLWVLAAAAVGVLASAPVRASDASVAASPPAGAPRPAPDAPTVNARVDKNEARVGDVISLTVTAVSPRTIPVNLPAKPDLSPFEILDPDKLEEERDLGDGRVSRSFGLKVAAYEPGELTIPPVELTYIGKDGHVLTTRTAPVPVKIVSLLANEPEPQLKEAAAPVPVLEQDLTFAYIGGGLLAAGLGALLALYLRRKIRAHAALRPPPPPRPVHEIALEKLDRLGTVGFLENADFRPFYFQLSEVVREYLGARFGFEALEMTTEELVEELQRRGPRALVLGELEGWLSGCDLVKFAKVSPSATEARGALETAIRIVESTRPRPEPQVGQGRSVPAPSEETRV